MWTDKMCVVFIAACKVMHNYGENVDAGTEYLISLYHSKDISCVQLSFLIDNLVDEYLHG